jgi:hypothetical protein
MKKDYIPHRDGDIDTYENTFVTEIDAIATACGIPALDVTALKATINAHRTKYTAMITAQNSSQNAGSANKTSKKTSVTGMRAMANRLKASPAFTDAMGRTLQVIGPDSTFDPDTAKPVLTLEMTGVDVKINFDHPREVNGVKIYSKRGSETVFSFLITDTKTPYIDTRDNQTPGSAENRKYYAFFFMDDAIIGLQSDEVSISITR